MKALGFGCVVWDDISDNPKAKGPQNIGGTIFNMVVHLKRLGDEASIITAIGDDILGSLTIHKMKELGIGIEFVKIVSEPTCLVKVTFDENKNWSYSMDDRVSWDFIFVNDKDIDNIKSHKYDVFFFGTLEQRNYVSRNSLIKILKECRFDTVYLDLNLRAPFYLKEIVEFSLKKCTIAKMNMEEAIMTNKMLDINTANIEEFMASLRQIYAIDKIIITDGKNGAYFSNKKEYGYCNGYIVDLVDPVGAGDAFSAGLLHKLDKGYSLEQACDFACKVGAMICSAKSSIPDYTLKEVHKLHKRRETNKNINFFDSE